MTTLKPSSFPTRFRTLIALLSDQQLHKLLRPHNADCHFTQQLTQFCQYLTRNQLAEPQWFEVMYEIAKFLKLSFLPMFQRAFRDIIHNQKLLNKVYLHGEKFLSLIQSIINNVANRNLTILKQQTCIYTVFNFKYIKKLTNQLKLHNQLFPISQFQNFTPDQLKIYEFVHLFKTMTHKVHDKSWVRKQLQHIKNIQEEKIYLGQHVFDHLNSFEIQFLVTQLQFFNFGLKTLRDAVSAEEDRLRTKKALKQEKMIRKQLEKEFFGPIPTEIPSIEIVQDFSQAKQEIKQIQVNNQHTEIQTSNADSQLQEGEMRISFQDFFPLYQRKFQGNPIVYFEEKQEEKSKGY